MSRSYKRSIRDNHYTKYNRIRRRLQRHKTSHELRNLMANQSDNEDSAGDAIIGWGARMGWTETIDDKFIVKSKLADRSINRWMEPYNDGFFYVDRTVLKELDKEERFNQLAKQLHHKYDRYLKDKHRKHQGKAKKRK